MDVASNTLQDAYCSAGDAIPPRRPLVQMGSMVSSNLDSIVSCPVVDVANCVIDLNKFRKDCSRLADRFSVIMVDARLRLSSNFVWLMLL